MMRMCPCRRSSSCASEEGEDGFHIGILSPGTCFSPLSSKARAPAEARATVSCDQALSSRASAVLAQRPHDPSSMRSLMPCANCSSVHRKSLSHRYSLYILQSSYKAPMISGIKDHPHGPCWMCVRVPLGMHRRPTALGRALLL